MKQKMWTEIFEKEWLGKNPNNWEVIKNKYLFQVSKKIVGEKSSDFQLLSMGKYGVNNRDIESGIGKYPASFDGYQIVEPNDLILCLFDMDETPRTVGYSKLHGMITSAYTVVKCFPEIDPKFIYYLYLSVDDRKGLRPFYTGLRKVVKSHTFLNIKIKIPSIPEQKQIIQFLDDRTKEIDFEITKNQKLIKLLVEKKQSLKSKAVTKGLDSTVTMKNSGIEWIGQIPKHWKIYRLGFITKEINDINHEMPESVDDGFPFLSAKDLLDNGQLNFKGVKQISEKDFKILSQKVKPQKNDIIYSRIGAKLGKARLVKIEKDFLISYSCCVIRTNITKLMPEFASFSLDSDFVLTDAKLSTQGIGVPDLGLNEIRKFLIPTPPINEQKEISCFLKNIFSQIDELLIKTESQIKKLRELRSTLVSSLSFGQINIKEVVEP